MQAVHYFVPHDHGRSTQQRTHRWNLGHGSIVTVDPHRSPRTDFVETPRPQDDCAPEPPESYKFLPTAFTTGGPRWPESVCGGRPIVDQRHHVHDDRAEPRPEQERRREDEHADARPQVDVHTAAFDELVVALD